MKEKPFSRKGFREEKKREKKEGKNPAKKTAHKQSAAYERRRFSREARRRAMELMNRRGMPHTSRA